LREQRHELAAPSRTKVRPPKKIRTAGPDAPTGFEKDGMETKAEPGEKDKPWNPERLGTPEPEEC